MEPEKPYFFSQIIFRMFYCLDIDSFTVHDNMTKSYFYMLGYLLQFKWCSSRCSEVWHFFFFFFLDNQTLIDIFPKLYLNIAFTLIAPWSSLFAGAFQELVYLK